MGHCQRLLVFAVLLANSISLGQAFFAAAVNPVLTCADDVTPLNGIRTKPVVSTAAKSATQQTATVNLNPPQFTEAALNASAVEGSKVPSSTLPPVAQTSILRNAKNFVTEEGSEPAPARRPSRAFSVGKSPEADKLQNICAAMPLHDAGSTAESDLQPDSAWKAAVSTVSIPLVSAAAAVTTTTAAAAVGETVVKSSSLTWPAAQTAPWPGTHDELQSASPAAERGCLPAAAAASGVAQASNFPLRGQLLLPPPPGPLGADGGRPFLAGERSARCV